ncbi:MAG: hypothetical protein RLZ94_1694 [Actinomycetota bacterium]
MRRPIFWFLWPAATPGPLDAAASQTKWARVCGRGPWRWGFLVACTAAVVTLSSAALAVVVAQPGWLALVLSAVVVIPLIALLARAWVAGTYVSDRGIKVSRILSTEAIPWSAVGAVGSTQRSRCLGTPLRIPGTTVTISDATGRVMGTHIETASPDLWLRPQSFDAARDRLGTWLRETR